MAEGGVDRITAMRVAGHVTDKMWSKYSQVRMDSVREKLMEAFTPHPQREEARVQVKTSVRELSPSTRPKINKAPVFSSSFTFTGGFYVTGKTW
jgi:hypothetical protein